MLAIWNKCDLLGDFGLGGGIKLLVCFEATRAIGTCLPGPAKFLWSD